eukprot:1161276-Pelagomonas_calceolata.AAC.5
MRPQFVSEEDLSIQAIRVLNSTVLLDNTVLLRWWDVATICVRAGACRQYYWTVQASIEIGVDPFV